MSPTLAEHPPNMQALEKANRHKRLREATVRELAAYPTMRLSRERCARLLLDDAPPHLETMKVAELIAACRGTGEIRARVMMRRAGLDPDRKILRSLSVPQALAIAGQLRTAAGEQLELTS